MVDRTARDRLALAIEDFLGEKIGAFEFDDRINEAADDTVDETLWDVAKLLWLHYDDYKDHTAALSRAEWDYFQRLLLLLRSESSLQSDRRVRWTGRQAVALAAILAFAAGAFRLGFAWHLLLVTIPLGVVSMALRLWPGREPRTHDTEFVRLTPYSSVSELLAVHRTIPGFRKRRYPVAMEARRIRGPITNVLMMIPFGALWLIFSPVVLFFQTLPDSEETMRVVPA